MTSVVIVKDKGEKVLGAFPNMEIAKATVRETCSRLTPIGIDGQWRDDETGKIHGFTFEIVEYSETVTHL